MGGGGLPQPPPHQPPASLSLLGRDGRFGDFQEILIIFQLRLGPDLSCQLMCLLTIVRVLTIVS